LDPFEKGFLVPKHLFEGRGKVQDERLLFSFHFSSLSSLPSAFRRFPIRYNADIWFEFLLPISEHLPSGDRNIIDSKIKKRFRLTEQSLAEESCRVLWLWLKSFSHIWPFSRPFFDSFSFLGVRMNVEKRFGGVVTTLDEKE
jgi:hypothetical protein